MPNRTERITVEERPSLWVGGGQQVNATAAEGVEASKERGLISRLRRKRLERNVSFPELVWMHHLRQQALESSHRPYTGAAEERYRDFEARFEAQQGKIVSAYWCTDEASGILLTVKRSGYRHAATLEA